MSMSGRELLVYLAVKHRGEFEKVFQAIKDKEKVEEDEAMKVINNIGNYVTILDPNYPDSLKRIPKPPIVLFYRGNISLLNAKKIVAVIGSREATDYGVEVTTTLVQGLLKDKSNKKTVILSGLARGIDTTAHKAALDVSGSTIAVLGSGIDVVYPTANKDLYDKIIEKDGLIISEYPAGVDPQKDHFPARDRIIAGLASSVLVTEAQDNSGTLITVAFALMAGKDIMAVPNKITDTHCGCNKLIQDGAFLVTNADDVIYMTKGESKSSDGEDK